MVIRAEGRVDKKGIDKGIGSEKGIDKGYSHLKISQQASNKGVDNFDPIQARKYVDSVLKDKSLIKSVPKFLLRD